MKRFFISSSFCCILCIVFSSCDVYPERSFDFCSFVNNSDRDVCIRISGQEYPDTLYPPNSGVGQIAEAHKETGLYSNGYDKYSRREQYFADYPVVQLFVIDREVAYNQRSETIRRHNLVLRRYEVTREWMEQHNWTIIYP